MAVTDLLNLDRLGISGDVTYNLGLTEQVENLHFSKLVSEAICRNEGELSRKGTLVIQTRVDDTYGKQRHTGRTPAARYIVNDAEGVDFSNQV